MLLNLSNLSILIFLFVIFLITCNINTISNFSNNDKVNLLRDKKIRFCVINSDKRKANVDKLEKDIDITLEKWPAVFTDTCPGNNNYSLYAKKLCKTCRGLSIAHKEIWYDFINSESDFIVIFEDDAELESSKCLNIFYDKINNLTADITYLGHCFGHLCLHAYALSKEGAKILTQNVKNCGPAIDEQLSQLILTKIIDAEFVKNPNEKSHWTNGLFHQIGKTDSDGTLQQYSDYNNANFLE